MILQILNNSMPIFLGFKKLVKIALEGEIFVFFHSLIECQLKAVENSNSDRKVETMER